MSVSVSTEMLSKVRVGILMFEGHALGRMMLTELKLQGIIPCLVIEERSKLAEKRCGFYYRQMAVGNPDLPFVKDFVEMSEGKTQHQIVANINNEESEAAAFAANIDVFLLGGARIIKDHMLETSKHGSINCHPGILPWIQGSLPVCRSIIHDIPLACACQRVTSDLDKGALCDISFLDRETCGKRFEDLIVGTCQIGAVQVCNVIKHIAATGEVPTFEVLSKDEGVCFTWDDNTEQQARDKLAEPGYVAPVWRGPDHIPHIPEQEAQRAPIACDRAP
jgi:hypothetical protein